MSSSRNASASLLISIGQGDIVPPDMMRVYADKFFTHLHNPTLVTHKETFLTGISSGTVPPLLCLSIAAISSRSAHDIPSLIQDFATLLPRRKTCGHGIEEGSGPKERACSLYNALTVPRSSHYRASSISSYIGLAPEKLFERSSSMASSSDYSKSSVWTSLPHELHPTQNGLRWKRGVVRSGVVGLSIHLMRRERVSLMLLSGIPLPPRYLVQKVSMHRRRD
jgi:hypothetical protein